MSFGTPLLLVALALIPALIALYVFLARRQTSKVVDLAAQGFTPTAATLRLRRRRHIPYVFFLFGLALLLLSVARPRVALSVPEREGTVVLAFDVSNSMRAVDLEPTRLEAAKVAASAFVDRQPATIKIAVVAFSDGAIVTQQATEDRDLVLAAIKRLSPNGSTGLGQGIFASLNAIAGKPIAPNIGAVAEGLAAPDGASDVSIGYFGSAAIVLLSDGEDRSELDPGDMANLASSAGVKIYTIGVGSAEGTTVEIDGFSVATALDEALLTELAEVTNGKYFSATNTETLTEVYESIDLKWKTQKKDTEISWLLSGMGAVLFTIGALLSLRWFGRLI